MVVAYMHVGTIYDVPVAICQFLNSSNGLGVFI